MQTFNTKKILFFDIDGTILSEETHSIPASASDAILKARNNGHIAIIIGTNAEIQRQSFEIVLDENGTVVISVSGYGIFSDSDEDNDFKSRSYRMD